MTSFLCLDFQCQYHPRMRIVSMFRASMQFSLISISLSFPYPHQSELVRIPFPTYMFIVVGISSVTNHNTGLGTLLEMSTKGSSLPFQTPVYFPFPFPVYLSLRYQTQTEMPSLDDHQIGRSEVIARSGHKQGKQGQHGHRGSRRASWIIGINISSSFLFFFFLFRTRRVRVFAFLILLPFPRVFSPCNRTFSNLNGHIDLPSFPFPSLPRRPIPDNSIRSDRAMRDDLLDFAMKRVWKGGLLGVRERVV